MSLITCPECGGSVSTKAPGCPHCGAAADVSEFPEARPTRAATPPSTPPVAKKSKNAFAIILGLLGYGAFYVGCYIVANWALMAVSSWLDGMNGGDGKIPPLSAGADVPFFMQRKPPPRIKLNTSKIERPGQDAQDKIPKDNNGKIDWEALRRQDEYPSR